MSDLENIGLLKMDFLGLRNLTMIQDTLEMVKDVHGVELDMMDLPMDDRPSYELLSRETARNALATEDRFPMP